MGKEKEKAVETWGEKVKEFGGGNFTFLSEDGETITFIVVGLPVLMKSVYQKKEQDRIGCPVVTDNGYQLFICGKRLFRKLSKHETIFKTNALMVTRHGAGGDTGTKYDVHVLPEKETFERLDVIRKEDFIPSMIADSVAEATKVMSG